MGICVFRFAFNGPVPAPETVAGAFERRAGLAAIVRRDGTGPITWLRAPHLRETVALTTGGRALDGEYDRFPPCVFFVHHIELAIEALGGRRMLFRDALRRELPPWQALSLRERTRLGGLGPALRDGVCGPPDAPRAASSGPFR